LPLISQEIEGQLFAVFTAKCHELDVVPVALGGTADHVHLLLRFRPTTALAVLVQHLKGTTSHLFNEPHKFFKWQGAYGAFTVSPSGVTTVRDYVLNQKEHHARNTLVSEMEYTNEQP